MRTDELDLAIRSCNVPLKAGITITEIAKKMTDHELRVVKHIPEKCVKEIREAVHRTEGKAILVLDRMPKSCKECGFLQVNQDTYDDMCFIEQLIKISKKKRPEYCPLRKLPERETEMTDADDLGKDYVGGTKDGWNACLEEIDPSENL